MRSSPLFVVSWVLLLFLAVLLGGYSSLKAVSAFQHGSIGLTPSYTIEQLAAANPEAATALRGQRVTAATIGLACAILVGFVVVVPYRRGERWAWWALLLSVGLSQVISMGRYLALGTTQGIAASAIVVVILLLGLAAGAPRIFAKVES